MSHFSVLVAVSGDVPFEREAVYHALCEILDPYDENREVDPYWVPIEQHWSGDEAMAIVEAERVLASSFAKTTEALHELADNAAFGTGPVKREPMSPRDAEVDLSAKISEMIGLPIRRTEAGSYEFQSTWGGQDGKWDWWQWGGRWANSIPVKTGRPSLVGERSWTNEKEVDVPGKCDGCRVEDLDIEGMRLIMRHEGQQAFELIVKRLTERDIDVDVKPIRQKLDAVKAARDAGLLTPEQYAEQMDFVRDEHWVDPYVVTLKETGKFGFFDDPVQVMLDYPDEDAWMRRYEQWTLSAHAIVTPDRGWEEQGQMGWFGFSTDDMDESTWTKVIETRLSELPVGTILCMVDCHV